MFQKVQPKKAPEGAFLGADFQRMTSDASAPCGLSIRFAYLACC